MISLQNMRFSTKIAVSVAAIVVTTACSDPTSQNVENLTPYWEVDINNASQQVSVEGFASDDDLEPANSGDSMPSFSDAVRLTAGDTLSLNWAGSNRQLFRRNAEFLYSRTFALPAESLEFEARFDRRNAQFESAFVSAPVPDLSTVVLTEEALEVADTSTLNLTWEIDTSVHNLQSQVIEAIPLSCDGLAVDTVPRSVDVDNSARSLSVLASELPRDGASGAQRCRYAIQFSARTIRTGDGFVDITTRSRLLETTIVFSDLGE